MWVFFIGSLALSIWHDQNGLSCKYAHLMHLAVVTLFSKRVNAYLNCWSSLQLILQTALKCVPLDRLTAKTRPAIRQWGSIALIFYWLCMALCACNVHAMHIFKWLHCSLSNSWTHRRNMCPWWGINISCLIVFFFIRCIRLLGVANVCRVQLGYVCACRSSFIKIVCNRRSIRSMV